jgi:histidinol phosphatase-like PHP family hydrolase
MVDNRLFDTHIHVESEHMNPYTALELIREMGLKAALVDHVFSDRNRITSDSIKSDCRKKFPDVEFIHGCEVDVYGNGLIALPENLVSSMDFIMVSFTHVGQPRVIEDSELNDIEKLATRLMYLFEAAVNWPHTDVIAHPFALFLDSLKAKKLVKSIQKEHLNKILRRVAKRNILIEINARTLRRMALEPQKIFLQEALQCGCLFSVGSDAHCLEEIGKTNEAWDIIDELKIPSELIVFPCSNQKSDKIYIKG